MRRYWLENSSILYNSVVMFKQIKCTEIHTPETIHYKIQCNIKLRLPYYDWLLSSRPSFQNITYIQRLKCFNSLDKIAPKLYTSRMYHGCVIE